MKCPDCGKELIEYSNDEKLAIILTKYNTMVSNISAYELIDETLFKNEDEKKLYYKNLSEIKLIKETLKSYLIKNLSFEKLEKFQVSNRKIFLHGDD